jgi:hypothetical protein
VIFSVEFDSDRFFTFRESLPKQLCEAAALDEDFAVIRLLRDVYWNEISPHYLDILDQIPGTCSPETYRDLLPPVSPPSPKKTKKGTGQHLLFRVLCLCISAPVFL